ncbi:unnamed protein product [Diamesa serratosioi]
MDEILKLIDQNQHRIAFDRVVEVIKNDPNNKNNCKNVFSFVLNNLGSDLLARNEIEEIFSCFEVALSLFPSNSSILNELGVILQKLDKVNDSFNCFQQSFDADRTNLKAYQNLQNIINQVERWHFHMLNDHLRNDAYKQALEKFTKDGKHHTVLDIGSGTGLLSLYAALCGELVDVTSCERNETMVEISKDVYRENSMENRIKVISKMSQDLKIGQDIPEKVSLIVTETLDSGVFGEGILQTLIHAKKHLLQDVIGKIIPNKVKIYITGYQSKTLASSKHLLNDNFYEYIFLENYRFIAKKVEPYDGEFVENIRDFRLVTDTKEALEVNFNDLDSMVNHFKGKTTGKCQLVSDVSDDYLDGFVVWFKLFLDENDPENFITSAPNSDSCWNQAIFKLDKRIFLGKQQELNITVTAKDGTLELQHDLISRKNQIYYEFDSSVIRFLNDEDFLNELEISVSTVLKNFGADELLDVLDFLPFPYIGLLLMKEKRLKSLCCKKTDEKIIRIIAKKNCIDDLLITFVESPYDLLEEDESSRKFDLIIVSPFDPLGDLDNLQICEISTLQGALKPNGIMIPHKIHLFGELINCDWLVNACQVTDENVKAFKIDKFINKYATELHLDLDCYLNYNKLTEDFKIADIYLDDELHESNVKVLIRNTNLPIHAIFYFFKIQFTSKSAECFSTKRKVSPSSSDSYIKRAAYILRKELSNDSSHVNINFLQNNGIFKCDVN